MILFVTVISVLLMGCQAARMRVRQELFSAAEEMRVAGRWALGFTKPFSFGSYQVTDVKRDWTESSGFSINLAGTKKLSSINAITKYEFKLRDGKEDVWKCKCAITRDEGSLDFKMNKKTSVGMGLSRKAFICNFKAEDKPGLWELAMSVNDDSSGNLKGMLSGAATSFLIQGTHKMADGVWDLGDYSGFEFFLDEKIVGAVEIINAGAVWILPSLDENLKSPLAVVSAAMLLYKEAGGR